MARLCFTNSELKDYGVEGMTTSQKRQFIQNKIADLEFAKKNSMLQTIVEDNALKIISTHPNGAKAGLQSYLYTDRSEMFGRSSIDARFEAMKSKSQSQIAEMMSVLMPGKLGLGKKTSQQIDLVHALFGKAELTGKGEYQQMAIKWNKLIEDLKARYLAAGGNPKNVQAWSIPQGHDPYLINKAGFEKWYDDTIDLIDLEKMGLDMADAPTELRKQYDSLARAGVESDITSTGVMRETSESNYIQFKDSDAWLEYNGKYSESTPYMMMMDKVNSANTEIVLMEHFGPNPNKGFEEIADIVDSQEGEGASDFAKMAYDNLAGHLNAPASRRKFADYMQSLRNLTTGLKLPSAALAVVSDVAFNTLTAKYNGLPGMKVAMTFIKNLKPESKADQKFAAQMWFTLDHMLDEATSASRFSDAQGQASFSRFSTSIMRGSGLQAATIAGKKAFHYEYMAMLAKGEFNDRAKAAFKRYGITGEDLKEIKASKKINRKGVEYLDPAELSQGAGERVVAMLSAESKFAVPEADLMTKSVMNQGTKKGTVGGELIRTGAQFKTFPATIIMNHWMRAMNGFEGNNASRIGYMASMAVMTTALGAMVLQLKEVAKGKTPRDMSNQEFWTDAMLQGGAASILGDMLSSDSRSFGGTMQEFLFGPSASMANDILWKGVLGTGDDLKKGDRGIEDYLKGAVAGSADYVPYQFWYTKEIMNRVLLDSMRKLGDPKWELKKAKKEARQQREYKNERYFK